MIKYLEWESKHFNKEIYRLVDHRITNDQLRECLEAKDIDLIQCRCDVSKTKAINLLCSYGFELVNVSITLSKEINQVCDMDEHIFVATKNDIYAIKDIATNSFSYSRFFHPFFDNNRARNIYAQWAEKSVTGKFDDICFVAKETSVIFGFVTLRFVSERVYRIGLIAVNADYKGKGVGKKLLNGALNYASSYGCTSLIVETQYENKDALVLYRKLGFSLELVEAWMYLIP